MVGKGEVQRELCVVVLVGLVSALFLTLFIVPILGLLHQSGGLSYFFRWGVVDYVLFHQFRVES